jgi:hypothetical protein
MERTSTDSALRDREEQEVKALEGQLPQDGNTKEPQQEKKDLLRDGGESGAARGPPQPVSFWHPSLYHVRNHIVRMWLRNSTFKHICFPQDHR